MKCPMFKFVQRKHGGTQGCKRELRILNNEVWLEGTLAKTSKMLIKLPVKLLKLGWIKKPQVSV